jgi:hypothetical protein
MSEISTYCAAHPGALATGIQYGNETTADFCTPVSCLEATTTTTTTCSCDGLQRAVDDYVALNESARSTTSSASTSGSSGSSGTSGTTAMSSPSLMPADTFQHDLEVCSGISKFVWEDEDRRPLTDDTAFNCRDFSRWFYECMLRSGHEVSIMSVYCAGCDSGSSHAHAINIYKAPDGRWCPHEPQRGTTTQPYTECCVADKGLAQQCALDTFCRRRGQKDACCSAGSTSDSTPTISDEKCRWIVDKDGKPYLNCQGPAPICIGTDPPIGQPPPPKPVTPCEAAINTCLADHPTGPCEVCKRSQLAECQPPLPPPPVPDPPIDPKYDLCRNGSAGTPAPYDACARCCRFKFPNDTTCVKGCNTDYIDYCAKTTGSCTFCCRYPGRLTAPETTACLAGCP